MLPKSNSKYIIIFFLVVLVLVGAYSLLTWSSIFQPNLLSSSYYKDILDEQHPLGILASETTITGDTTVTMTGILQAVYANQDKYYLDVLVPYKGQTILFKVDLGKKDFKLQELTSSFDESGVSYEELVKNGEKATFTNSYQAVTPQYILEKYGGQAGKVIRVDILTRMSSATKTEEECSETCQSRRAEFKTHSVNNQRLEKLTISNNILGRLLNKPIIIEVGMPVLVSLSK